MYDSYTSEQKMSENDATETQNAAKSDNTETVYEPEITTPSQGQVDNQVKTHLAPISC